MHRTAQTHAEVAQWPKHQARDWKDVGLSPSRRISISRIKFLCWLKTCYKKIFIFLNEQYITGWITALNITQQQTQPSPKQSITSTSQHSHFTQLQPTEASPPPQRHPQTMCTVWIQGRWEKSFKSQTQVWFLVTIQYTISHVFGAY